MNIFFEFIKYRLNAKGRHVIHSPLVYQLVDQGLNIRIDALDRNRIHQHHKALINDHNLIDFMDYGAGSKVLKSQRKISEIYKVSGSKKKHALLLYQLCRHFKPQSILELGTSLGSGTLHMHLGHPNAQITSLDAESQIIKITDKYLSTLSLEHQNISLQNKLFDVFLSEPTNQTYDLVFLDGHHNGQATLKYMDKIKDIIHGNSVVIIDDIRWSSDMFEAWTELTKSKHFNVSLDFFKMGVLMPRPMQDKEHFVIRY